METSFAPHSIAVEREADLERLGNQIAALSAHLDAATATLLDMIREFDARDGWSHGGGFLSCAHWLSYRTNIEIKTARERVRVARALGTLPRLAEALACGQLSYAKVRAVTRVATPDTEEVLLKVGREATASQLERIVRGWRRVDRNEEAKLGKRQHQSRALHVYQDEDGTVVIRGRLAPEAGAVLMRSLDAAREALYQRDRLAEPEQRNHPQADPPSMEQKQADALILLAEAALCHELDPGAPGERYQVVVHVDAAVLADAEQPGQSVLEDGARVSAEASQRLACDASRVVMRHDADGNIVEVGARTRTIPPALRRALMSRDRGCRFPGCGRRFGDGHHIEHWAHGGPTTLSNLVILCRRHHRAIHEEGYDVERQPDGTVRFRRPGGWPLPNVPTATPVPADPVGALTTANIARGLTIDGKTSKPGWCGERFDLAYIIDVLHPAARRS
jgi:hypothetical protein